MLSGMYAAAIAWAREHLDHAVDEVVPIKGGMTSAMLALRDEAGAASVLRLITEEPWRSHGRELVMRESVTQRAVAGTGIPAPLSLAIDRDGDATGHPAHLMTLVPGSPDETRCDDGSLAAIADLLAAIHRVVSTPVPRDFQSWAWPAKWVVPAWSCRPDLWQSAFDVLAQDPPAFESTFLHRDFGPHNLLWVGDSVTGVVDWVETSTGPAWLDVAHCSTNLALRHGSPAGQRFASAYTRLTGVQRAPYWEVMDVVGFLPPPGRRPMFDDPTRLARLEEHLAWAIGS
jgi:aminoglycoside phosphotransferase (APT) family kinase protein